MRTLTVLSVFLFGIGAILVFQNQQVLAQDQQVLAQGEGGAPLAQVSPQYTPYPSPPSSGPRGDQFGGQPDRQPPWVQQGGGPPQQPGGQRGPGGRGGPPQQPGGQRGPGGGGPPGAMQGNQPPGGAMSADQVTQMMARLRAMDTNGRGTLTISELPPNQQARVTAMVQRFGVNPNGPINLADLERRAMRNVAGNPQPNRRQNDPATERQQRQQPVEALVPPFGEPRAAEKPTLGFGQRDAVAQNPTPATSGSRAATPVNPQAVRPANAVKSSAAYDNIPAEVRANQNFSWFFEYDTDKDAQLTMLEYINGCGGYGTEGIANEFIFLDRNGDGLVTIDEALTSIQERDKAKAAAAAAQQQQAGVRQESGGGSRSSSQPPRQPASAQPARSANPANPAAAPNVRTPGNYQENRGSQPSRGNQGNSRRGRESAPNRNREFNRL